MARRASTARAHRFALLMSAGSALPALAQCPPSVPQSLSASDGTSCSAVELDWLNVSGATSYRIYRGTSAVYANSSLIGTSLTSDFSDILASPGVQYYYWVVAVRALCLPGSTAGNPAGPNSGYRADDPAAPVNVEASDASTCNGILVTWEQPYVFGGSPTGFSIWRNTVNLYLTSSNVGTTNGSTHVFFDDTAEPGETYWYWVRAENACGTAASSGDSGTVSNMTPALNDTCETAFQITPGTTYTGTTACAGASGLSPCNASAASRDVWYRYSSAQAGTLHLSTCGAAGSFNTVLSAYLGPCPVSFSTQIGCDDNGCPSSTLSTLDVPIAPGIQYFIRVGGATSYSFGSFVLTTGFTPSGVACYANCDGSTTAPILNVSDFGCFLTKFAAGDPYANCDGSTQAPTLNVADFGCFLNKFAAGCP